MALSGFASGALVASPIAAVLTWGHDIERAPIYAKESAAPVGKACCGVGACHR